MTAGGGGPAWRYLVDLTAGDAAAIAEARAVPMPIGERRLLRRIWPRGVEQPHPVTWGPAGWGLLEERVRGQDAIGLVRRGYLTTDFVRPGRASFFTLTEDAADLLLALDTETL